MNLVKKKKTKKQLTEMINGNNVGVIILDGLVEHYQIVDADHVESITSLKGQLNANNAVLQAMLDGFDKKH